MVCFLDLLFDCNSRSGILSSSSNSHSFSLFKILPAAGVGSADGDFIDDLLESIDKISFCLALFVAHLIEEIKPIISVVSDRSGFDLIKSYVGISESGTIGDDVLLFSVGF
jgi:hypothetical protein